MQNRQFLLIPILMLFALMVGQTYAGHLVHKYAPGPVLKTGQPGDWDAQGVFAPKVLFREGKYHMWYTGVNQMSIGYAESHDGIKWSMEESNQVLKPGPPSAWDAGWVGAAEVIFLNGKYHMWYCGARELPMREGSLASIGYAVSQDGKTWHKYEDNPVIRDVLAGGDFGLMAYAPTVIASERDLQIWYTSYVKGEIGISTAFSRDGTDWNTYTSNPVISTGAKFGTDFVGAPYMIRDGSGYILYYTAVDNGEAKIRYANSIDGLLWQKANTDVPICAGECYGRTESFIGNGSVLRHKGVDQFWYNARIDGKWQISYAEDFESIPHVDMVDCAAHFHSVMRNPEDEDILHLEAVVHGTDGNTVDVNACIRSLDGNRIVSFPMSKSEVDDIWVGEWKIPQSERTYDMIVTANCQETGSVNCSENWIPTRFTTIGPIEVPGIEAYWLDDNEEVFTVRLTASSAAIDAVAENVTARIRALDNEKVLDVQNIQEFGDIQPLQSLASSTITYFYTDPKYQDRKDRFPVEISFDYDGFEMMVIDKIIEPLPATSSTIQEKLTPTRFELTQNYPNPFNPATTIKFSLPSAQNVVLNIYNTLGEHVATLVNEPLSYGSYSYLWHAGNMPSGIYYYQLLAGPYSQVKKMVLVK